MSEGELLEPRKTLVLSEGIRASLGHWPSFLGRASLQLLAARTGSEALTLARASGSCTLILEYELPDARADQVCSDLRGSNAPGVQVVIVGPSEPGEIEALCRKAGCDLFIPTPVDFPDLLTRLANLLDLSARRTNRLPVVLSVSYGRVTSDSLGHSRDLSVGGMCLETATALPEGSYLNLKFFLEGDEGSIVTPGQIVRVQATEEGSYEVGIRFLDLPEEAHGRLQRFLEDFSG
jgi:uncharacterized protein (TIGR02266 family)